MNFLAILRDSIRETMDAMVFYILVGLSLILALVAASISYEVVPDMGKRMIEEFGLLGLNVESPQLDPSRQFDGFLKTRPVSFTLDSAEPMDGVEDLPASQFKLEMTASFSTAEAVTEARKDPHKLEEYVRERLGLIEGRHMLEATDVHLTGWEGLDLGLFNFNIGGSKAKFEVTTQPTPVTNRFWSHRVILFFGALPLSNIPTPLFRALTLLESTLIGGFGSTVAVLIGVVITAFYIPNMLRKGTIDLLIVKPISRPVLLLYKFIGGLTFIFFNTAVVVGVVWFVLGLRSGIWAPTFLLNIFMLTFYFSVLYAVSTFVAVFTRSAIACILLTIAAWVCIFLITVGHTIVEAMRGVDRMAQAIHDKLGDDALEKLMPRQDDAKGDDEKADPPPDEPRPFKGGPKRGPQRPVKLSELRFNENWFSRTIDVLYFLIPPITDLYSLLDHRLKHDLAFGEMWDPGVPAQKPPELPGGIPLPSPTPTPPTWSRTLGASVGFMAVLLALSCWRFATRDY